jgi:ribosomal protein S18
MEKYSKKNLRGKWQEEELQNAMRVVRTSKISTNAAAIHYKVPRTLRAYLAKNKQSKSKMGRKTVLSTHQEKKLSKRIIRLSQTEYPITLKILRMRVHIL